MTSPVRPFWRQIVARLQSLPAGSHLMPDDIRFMKGAPKHVSAAIAGGVAAGELVRLDTPRGAVALAGGGIPAEPALFEAAAWMDGDVLLRGVELVDMAAGMVVLRRSQVAELLRFLRPLEARYASAAESEASAA